MSDTSCVSSDDGVIVHADNGGGGCYYRQFSGPVHLSWYGVPDAANAICYNASGSYFSGCDAAAIVQKAFAAAVVSAELGGDGGVTTDGRSIAVLSQCDGCTDDVAIEIPANQYLTCTGPRGTSWGQSGEHPKYYYDLPNSIVLNPGYTIKRDQASRFSSNAT